jgi:hypothetical protein
MGSDCCAVPRKLPEFSKFDFLAFGITEEDHSGKLEWLAASKTGGSILEVPDGAAVVLAKRQVNTAGCFSFLFDSRIILSHRIVNQHENPVFYKLVSDPSSYCLLDKVPDDIHPFRNDPSDFAIELSKGKAFLRMYLCPDLLHCYFKTSDGNQGDVLIMSPQLADEVKRLIKEFSEKSEDDSK